MDKDVKEKMTLKSRDIQLDNSYVLGRGMNLKTFKEIVKKKFGDVSNLQFLISYEFEDGKYRTEVVGWSSVVYVVNNVNSLLFVVGVMTTPFEVKAFDFPFVVV